MNTSRSLGAQLLEQRVEDFQNAISTLPLNVKFPSKMFAKTLGLSGGKILTGYNALFSGIESGNTREQVTHDVDRIIDRQSKVQFKIPIVGQRSARLCGLVALRHTDYFNAEVDLYAQLFEDLNSEQPLHQQVESLGFSQDSPYHSLLARKQQSIDDFEVLMGITQDKDRFSDLTVDMPQRLASYFKKVAKTHNGRFGLSWPISFNKYAGAIGQGLRQDSISYALQESLGQDYDFIQPSDSQSVVHKMREHLTSKPPKDASWNAKWKFAAALPVAAVYLSGVDAYAGEFHHLAHGDGHVLLPATTAGTLATTSHGDDALLFATSFVTLFTTTA